MFLPILKQMYKVQIASKASSAVADCQVDVTTPSIQMNKCSSFSETAHRSTWFLHFLREIAYKASQQKIPRNQTMYYLDKQILNRSMHLNLRQPDGAFARKGLDSDFFSNYYQRSETRSSMSVLP